MIINPVSRHLSAFYAVTDWSAEAANYVTINDLDIDAIIAQVGPIAIVGCRFDGCGYFKIGGDILSVVIEVRGDDGETVVDLLAWRVEDPLIFATAMGAAALLGHNLLNPATWAFGSALAVHRRPLDWVKAGARGVVILDHRLAPFALGQALGHLEAEDPDHLKLLRQMLCRPPVDPKNVRCPPAGKKVPA